MKFATGNKKNGIKGIHILPTSPLTEPDKSSIRIIIKVPRKIGSISLKFFFKLTNVLHSIYIYMTLTPIPKKIKKS